MAKNKKAIESERWLGEDGETWLMDPDHEILTDTNRSRLAGCAPELLEVLDELIEWAERIALPILGDDSDGGNCLIEGAKMVVGRARGIP